MTKAPLALLAALLAGVAVPARAELMYSFDYSLASGPLQYFGTGSGTLVLSDDALAAGGASFVADDRNNTIDYPLPNGGTVTYGAGSAFVSITGPAPLAVPFAYGAIGYIRDAAQFVLDPSGDILSGSVSIHDGSRDEVLTFANGSISGSYVADAGPCFLTDAACVISGTYSAPTHVPEPSSLALVLAPLLAVTRLARRRRPG